ncbi:hypothetical protein QWY82_18745 [Simiduia curdlanivorans]|uniref:Ribosomal protein L7/L12 C-terminal domain-containing protein n=1 Tax=Simiduia curdlanivorans TaxID=1492769 RepID=A0ABV8V5P1_9GAMM|nr:hypothetical protein [Simiduia curdlanivorans]MDN3640845.1 hypothetical protein [Simiduia curdlanivorans]
MSDGRFDIVFRGDIAPGQVLPQVKQRLAALFKRELAQIEPLFSGAPVALKKDVDQLSAEKYKKVLAQAGALVEIREAGTLKAPPARPRPVAKAEPATQPDEAPAPPAPAGLSLVPVGGFLLTDEERKQAVEPSAPVAQVNFELRPLEGSLVDENEIERMAPVQVADVEFDISEPGVELVEAQYKEVAEAVVVADLDVDLAPAGSDLGQLPKEPAPPAPDTSGIRLAD